MAKRESYICVGRACDYILKDYGRVLKVSRLRDKIITCYNNNLNIIYLPIQNKIDEEYIPEEVLQKVKLRYISTFDEVYNELFK